MTLRLACRRAKAGLVCLASLLAVCALLALACATTAKDRRYPARRPGCHLTVSYADKPLGAWDDIGVAQVGCYLDEGEGPCLHRLKVEACRMGGDVLYAVPKSAARPCERELTMRGRVAHTREAASKPEAPATAASNEPVVPLSAPAPASDGGTAENAPARSDAGG